MQMIFDLVSDWFTRDHAPVRPPFGPFPFALAMTSSPKYNATFDWSVKKRMPMIW